MHNKAFYKKLSERVPGFIKNLIPDFIFVRFIYYAVYGKFPNLRAPVTFDEKLQWYKLNHRNPLMTVMADKYRARKYVEDLGYADILNQLYFIKDKLTEDDFEGLPEKYVIKATHGCGMNIISDGKKPVDRIEAVKTMSSWLKTNHFYHAREWAYKNIPPAVICEKFLENKDLGELVDYKFYCYSGKPVVMFVCAGRYSDNGVRYNAYDMNWNRIYVTKGKAGLDFEFRKPETFEKMKKIAEDLCKGFPFIRVDLYSIDGSIYFSEFTFYPDSGIIPFSPDKYNKFFGDFFNLAEY